MTGFGRARREADGLAVEVELRSVNARGLTVRCRTPSDWARLEPKMEKALGLVFKPCLFHNEI